MSRSMRSGSPIVLKDVNVTIYTGELIYLIGRVGSGKSTLLKTLYAENALKGGRANVVGYDLRSLRRKDIPYLRRRMGIVFQDYQLLTDRNVYQNLLFVLKATGWRDDALIRERIASVLSKVGLKNKERKMVFELSGGEQQRVAIARALLNNPRLIIADEPTGNLDPAATNEIMSLLIRISQQDCAVIMSTHNIINIQQYPARTLRFNQGRVEEIDVQSILGV
ncbi:MAG: ATP-binding cassette domain-containing protein [Rikenellaceae bacterium]